MGFLPSPTIYKGGYSIWGFASLQSQYLSPVVGDWFTLDLKRYVPEGTKGIIVKVINTDAGLERYGGLRKNGQTYANIGQICRSSWTSAIVGLDENRKMQTYLENSVLHYLLQGYVGENWEFLDEPADVTPPVDSVWTETDCSPYGMGIAGIFELDNLAGSYSSYGYRKHGSEEDLKWGGYHHWFICPLDAAGKCDLFSWKSLTEQKIYLLGFIKSGITMYDTKQALTTVNDGTYRTLPLTAYKSEPILALIELLATAGSTNWAIRKNIYDLDVYSWGRNHNQCFIHPNTPNDAIRYKLADAGQTLYLIGIM